MTSGPPEEPASGLGKEWDTERRVTVRVTDIDFFGPNWASVKVSEGFGRILSASHDLAGGQFERSVTELYEMHMEVYRWPRIVVVAAGLVLAVKGGAVLLAKVAAALAGLEKLRLEPGLP